MVTMAHPDDKANKPLPTMALIIPNTASVMDISVRVVIVVVRSVVGVECIGGISLVSPCCDNVYNDDDDVVVDMDDNDCR